MISNKILLEEFYKIGNSIKLMSKDRYDQKVTVRSEFSNTSYAVESLIEIIFAHLANEDFYGYVFSMIIKDEDGNRKSIELSIIESDGPFIDLREFEINETQNVEDLLNEIKYTLDLQINILFNLMEKTLTE